MSAVSSIQKIFGHLKRIQSIAPWLLVSSILYGLVVLLEVFLICRPMAVDWNAAVAGSCADQIVSYLVLEILGLLLDSIILVVPIPCIWRLQMRRARKLSLSIIFSIGVL